MNNRYNADQRHSRRGPSPHWVYRSGLSLSVIKHKAIKDQLK